MSSLFPYTIFPLGDSALILDFGNIISKDINNYVLALFHHFKQKNIKGILDIVPAYSSLSFHYNIIAIRATGAAESAFESLKTQIEEELKNNLVKDIKTNKRVRIPVCYAGDFAPDISFIAAEKNISITEIIELHTREIYTVFMNGFLPGFPYMGEVNEKIAMPRKSQPRTSIHAGSVGIAGKQTGIYPMESPGGWQIIGRTPLKIFDKEKTEPVLLEPGDEIQFYSISENEFANY